MSPGRGVAVVTGAAGFAGTWLCRELRAHGRHVLGWVRRPVQGPVPGVLYRQVDLADPAAVRSALLADRPDEVYHLGALSHVGDCAADPDRAIRTNIGGTEHLLAGLGPGTRFVFASTCHVYGRPLWLPLDEDHPTSPDSLYGRTKETAERLVLAAVRSGVHAVVARAFHHTGPGQDPRYALPDWAAQLAAGPAGPVRTGALHLRRDFTDVRDVVAGYRLLAERAEPGAIVQLCSGRAETLRTLLTLLAGHEVPAEEQRARLRADDLLELRGSPARAEALGWRRRHSLEETLSDLARAAHQGGV